MTRAWGEGGVGVGGWDRDRDKTEQGYDGRDRGGEGSCPDSNPTEGHPSSFSVKSHRV